MDKVITRKINVICLLRRVVLFSAECTIGMVRGLTVLKHYGAMTLWRYSAMAIRCKL